MNNPSLKLTFKNTVDSRYGPGPRQKIRHLEKLKIKLAKEINHVTYLNKCKHESIFPKGLNLKAPYYSSRAKTILSTASIKLLKDRLNFHMSNKQRLNDQIALETSNLSQLIGTDLENILKTLNKSADRQNSISKVSQQKKLDNLRITQQKTKDITGRPGPILDSSQTDHAVVNLSDKSLNVV